MSLNGDHQQPATRCHSRCNNLFISLRSMILLSLLLIISLIQCCHSFTFHINHYRSQQHVVVEGYSKTTSNSNSKSPVVVVVNRQSSLSLDATTTTDSSNDTTNNTSYYVSLSEEEAAGDDEETLITENNSRQEEKLIIETADTTTTIKSNDNYIMMNNNKLFITSLGAITGRGEYANDIQHKSAMKVVEQLEKLNPTSNPCISEHIIGTWELIYSHTELFRSSPFFMAGRAVCQTDEQRDQYNFFCSMHRKALAISNIGPVRQVISKDKLISEFEVKVGAIPFLSDITPLKYSGGIPLTIDGAIVSTADIVSTSNTNNTNYLELYMDTVEIKGSNIPILRQLFDNIDQMKLQSRTLGKILEDNQSITNNVMPNYQTPRPKFYTTYLDEMIRISHDQDNNIFVYIKTSNSTLPTNYKSIDADFGIGKLLEQFNDAVTKISI